MIKRRQSVAGFAFDRAGPRQAGLDSMDAIPDGRQPITITGQWLAPMPISTCWAEHEKLLGFSFN